MPVQTRSKTWIQRPACADTASMLSSPPVNANLMSLPAEVRSSIFSYVLSSPEPTINLCGCLQRDSGPDCHQVIYNETPFDPKLSISLLNQTGYHEVRPLSPTKQSFTVCSGDCLFWTLKNATWRFKRLTSSILHTMLIKTPVPICALNRTELLANIFENHPQSVLCRYPGEALRHWREVNLEVHLTTDSVSSWIKVVCVVRVDEICSFMRHAPKVELTLDDIELTVKEERIAGVGHGSRH